MNQPKELLDIVKLAGMQNNNFLQPADSAIANNRSNTSMHSVVEEGWFSKFKQLFSPTTASTAEPSTSTPAKPAYTGIDPIVRQRMGMAPATAAEIQSYVQQNQPFVKAGDKNLTSTAYVVDLEKPDPQPTSTLYRATIPKETPVISGGEKDVIDAAIAASDPAAKKPETIVDRVKKAFTPIPVGQPLTDAEIEAARERGRLRFADMPAYTSSTAAPPLKESSVDFDEVVRAHESQGGKVTGRSNDYTVTLADGTRRRYITHKGRRRVEKLPPVSSQEDDNEGTTVRKQHQNKHHRGDSKQDNKKINEMTNVEFRGFVQYYRLLEEKMSKPQRKKKEEIVEAMKKTPKQRAALKRRYGDRWEEVAHATATKRAMQLVKEQTSMGSKPGPKGEPVVVPPSAADREADKQFQAQLATLPRADRALTTTDVDKSGKSAPAAAPASTPVAPAATPVAPATTASAPVRTASADNEVRPQQMLSPPGPAPVAPGEGRVGRALAQFGIDKSSRLNQQFINDMLGSSFKAGSAEANLALLAKLRAGKSAAMQRK